MSDSKTNNFISSKEILEKTGISRATLNNYIKLGIIPRPVVQRPVEGTKNIKRLGYFPAQAIDRIEEVKKLKKQGKSLEEAAGIFNNRYLDSMDKMSGLYKLDHKVFPPLSSSEYIGAPPEGIRLTLEDIFFPSYFLDYDFNIAWINQEAEERILRQKVRDNSDVESRNIFRLLFNPEFQSHVKNWRDLVAFHISYAKLRFAKTWLSKLYNGISPNVVDHLGSIYDMTSHSTMHTIQERSITLEMQDGSFQDYRIYGILSKGGIFFSYEYLIPPKDR